MEEKKKGRHCGKGKRSGTRERSEERRVGKECREDSLENIDRPRKSININITSSIWIARVTNIRTRLC